MLGLCFVVQLMSAAHIYMHWWPNTWRYFKILANTPTEIIYIFAIELLLQLALQHSPRTTTTKILLLRVPTEGDQGVVRPRASSYMDISSQGPLCHYPQIHAGSNNNLHLQLINIKKTSVYIFPEQILIFLTLL